MKVGEKKQFKANQKVKWTVKGKSVAIVKGKNAKAVTVQAKKKGSSTLTAKMGNKSAAAVKPGEYFRCSPFTYNNVTTYAALVISESDYQTMMKFRNEGNGNPQYTKSIATFYIVNKREHTFDLACSQNGAKYATVIPDEDTVINVNGVKEKDAGDRLQAGQRVLVQYGWESSPGNFVNLDSIVVY